MKHLNLWSMMMRICTGLFGLFLAVCGATAADSNDLPLVYGTLKKVEKDKITIAGSVVFSKGFAKDSKVEKKEIADKTFEVSTSAKITLNGKAAKLADLKTDVFTSYRLDKDMKVVEISQQTEALGLSAPSGFGGTLKAIKDGQLSLSFGKPFDLAKDCKVKIDGKDAKFEDLKTGQFVECLFDKDRKIVSIEQKSKK